MKPSPTRTLTGGALTGLVVSLVLLILIGHLSTPTSSGPVGILAVFTLIYVFFTSAIIIVTGIGTSVAARTSKRPAFSNRKRYYVSSVLGFLPVLYLTLLSMGGASIWGIILIILFTVLMLFYVLRRST